MVREAVLNRSEVKAYDPIYFISPAKRASRRSTSGPFIRHAMILSIGGFVLASVSRSSNAPHSIYIFQVKRMRHARASDGYQWPANQKGGRSASR